MTDIDWPHRAQQAGEAHLDTLAETLWEDHGGDPPARCEPSALAPVQAAADHLLACLQAMHADDEGEPVDDCPAVGPFCGCVTCEVREVLAAAWLGAEQAVRTGQIPPESAPDAYDGCPDCTAREVVVATWPVVVDAVAAGFALHPDLAAR